MDRLRTGTSLMAHQESKNSVCPNVRPVARAARPSPEMKHQRSAKSLHLSRLCKLHARERHENITLYAQ